MKPEIFLAGGRQLYDTPVAAGHDVFTTEQIEQVTGPFWNAMGVTREQFMALGNSRPNDQRFEMKLTDVQKRQLVAFLNSL